MGHILITGGAGGIGKSLSRAFENKNHHVMVWDVCQENQSATYCCVDITNYQSVVEAARQLTQVDTLVCNAGIMRRGKLLESSVDDFDAIFSVNVKGQWLVFKEVYAQCPNLKQVIFISSRHGIHPVEDPALYSISKHAVLFMADIAIKTYPHIDIRKISPGPTNTALAQGHRSAQEIEQLEHPDVLAQRIMEFLDTSSPSMWYDNESGKYRYD